MGTLCLFETLNTNFKLILISDSFDVHHVFIETKIKRFDIEFLYLQFENYMDVIIITVQFFFDISRVHFLGSQ